MTRSFQCKLKEKKSQNTGNVYPRNTEFESSKDKVATIKWTIIQRYNFGNYMELKLMYWSPHTRPDRLFLGV